LKTLGHEIRLVVDIGPVEDSAALRLAAEAARRQREAEQIIRDDPFVQTMMRDFGGKIVPGTLKATDMRPHSPPLRGSLPPEWAEPPWGGPAATR
jgi:DNA polymerase-3 subunit gamma/tau